MVDKREIVALEAFLPFVETMLDERFRVHRVWQAEDVDARVARLGDRVTGIAAFGHNRIDATLLDRLPGVGIISLMSVGFDQVDIGAARRRGVVVTNTPDVLTDEVADLAMGLVLASARQIVAGDRYVRSGAWRTGDMALTTGLTGRTMGILGLGRIGRGIARRAEAFRIQVVYGGRTPKPDAPWRYYDDPVAMARDSDVLVVAIPGGRETRHMVGPDVLDALGPEGILVNVARGSVVDEQALVEALSEGRLGGAGLDVFEFEPNVPEALIAMQHVVLQPHVGSATVQTRRKMAQLMVDNLVRHFAGLPPLTPVG
jgi:lactate dehydrogenase-like 2-hydroxyacid dehydrogenase